MVGRELWISSHKAKAKSKFLWKSLRLQRSHLVHKLITDGSGDAGPMSALMKRVRLKRGLGKQDDLEKDLKEKEKALADHKKELSDHQDELKKMKLLVANMKRNHSGALENEKLKSELSMKKLESVVEQEKKRLKEELLEVERTRRKSAVERDQKHRKEAHLAEAKAVMKKAEQLKGAAVKMINVRRSISQKKLQQRLQNRKSVSLKKLTTISHKRHSSSNVNLNQGVFEESLLFDDEPKQEKVNVKSWPGMDDDDDDDDGELFPEEH